MLNVAQVRLHDKLFSAEALYQMLTDLQIINVNEFSVF